MKKITVFAIALMMGVFVSTNAMAVVPELIPVQGVLADDVGEPIDGPTDITFSLYAAETGGTALWTDGFTDVDVVDGFFTAYLGSDTALDFATLISNTEIWLGIDVEGDGEMNRIQLAAVPFAIEAQVCQSVGTLTEADINTNFATAAHNHDAAYAPISHTHAWADITGVPDMVESLDCYTVSVTEDHTSSFSMTATCTYGYVVTGGGHNWTVGLADVWIWQSSPISETQYRVRGNVNRGGASDTITVYARCCRAI